MSKILANSLADLKEAEPADYFTILWYHDPLLLYSKKRLFVKILNVL